MDERKVNAVLNWPRPTTLKELQRFLGFSNFYRRFVRHLSSVAAPLTSMVKRGTSRLTCSQSAIQAFDDLRQRFSKAPILHHPDPNRLFVVEVDASSPQRYHKKKTEYLRSAKLLNHRQARWALLFTHFVFTVSYRPGSQNMKADALSRMHEPDLPTNFSETILPSSMIVAPVRWDIMTEITEAQAQDPPPADCSDNLLYVPLSLRPRVLAEVHAAPSSGHPGIKATLHLLHNCYWWPNQRADTVKFVKQCTVCNQTKVPHRLPTGLLQPLPVPQRPWSNIAVDFITDLPPSSGYTTILTILT
ncbi:Transposon Tf2-9 polyprotein [Labeo rohita]|uniref:Gypsy retrotransposon integrase-like protein 1 n=1 Tax=Labeo rohita TaxID=84645 RepID=A0ABQ8L5U3_LABRO|nr:Transposon Tf2-9 polyprotein [Labeo rohita]